MRAVVSSYVPEGQVYFQELIRKLDGFWGAYGCVLEEAYDVELGAGTMHPASFLRALGPEPWKVAYVQPCRRPADGRYGENPNRLYKHYQYQVILKPFFDDLQEVYLDSLEFVFQGLEDPTHRKNSRLRTGRRRPRSRFFLEHDVRFLEDDWEAPTLGAWELGWQVFLDGTEITQLTYFLQVGGMDVDPVSVEITYGLERIAMVMQRRDNVFDLEWAPGVTYGDVRRQEEVDASCYAFDLADVAMVREVFGRAEEEADRLLDAGCVLAAYDYVIKCSHLFNLLDARGAVGVAERSVLMGRCRGLARRCADAYVRARSAQGFPLLARETVAVGSGSG